MRDLVVKCFADTIMHEAVGRIKPVLLVLFSISLLFNSCTNKPVGANQAEAPVPMRNYYPDFKPEKESYVDYAKEKNRDFFEAMGTMSKSIACIYTEQPQERKIVLYNPGDTVEVVYLTRDGKRIQEKLEVGVNRGEAFECMGACGKACPELGVPLAFTRDCLIHDHCTLTFGIKPEVARDKHPECGELYLQAVDDWCRYGHVFME